MIKITSKSKCYGCSACASACPQNAINMAADKQGFLYPQIEESKCVECGKCRSICPAEKAIKQNENEPKVYAVKAVSESARMASSSGGVFTVVSDKILQKCGIIYGAGFDGDFVAYHKRAANEEDRDGLKGSKYVASELRDTLSQVKKDLENDSNVLFTGTSCQIAGLKEYLGGEYEKLYLIDLVCHGTPSPKVFEDYKKYLEKKYKSKIRNLTFRYKYKDKKYGLSTQAMKVEFTNGKIYKAHYSQDPYYSLFLNNYILRPSCYTCKFANFNKPADITLGDFWKVEKTMPSFQDWKGISLVIVHTEKGREIFNEIKNDVAYEASNTRDCIQSPLIRPSKYPEYYQEFWKDYFRKGFKYVAKKYTGKDFLGMVKGKLARLLKYRERCE